ncbi:hypothetical protein GCM10020255_072470 [Rhodococcus baikonurensis]
MGQSSGLRRNVVIHDDLRGSLPVSDREARNGHRPVWRDKKRYLWPLGLLVPLSPFAAWFLVDKFSLGLFWAIGAWLIVIVIPLIDLLAAKTGTARRTKRFRICRRIVSTAGARICSCPSNTSVSCSSPGAG